MNDQKLLGLLRLYMVEALEPLKMYGQEPYVVAAIDQVTQKVRRLLESKEEEDAD